MDILTKKNLGGQFIIKIQSLHISFFCISKAIFPLKIIPHFKRQFLSAKSLYNYNFFTHSNHFLYHIPSSQKIADPCTGFH